MSSFDFLPSKYKYGNLDRKDFRFFCPVCRKERYLSLSPKPGTVKHFFQILITTLLFTAATWSIFEWKGIFAFFVFWTIFEIVYRTKVRTQLYCKACGFDPYLHLVDAQRSREELEAFWKKKFEQRLPTAQDPDENQVAPPPPAKSPN